MSGVGCCRTANHWTAAADPMVDRHGTGPVMAGRQSPARDPGGVRPFLLAALKPLAAPSAAMIEAVS
jgi:hypothetical protein